MSALSHYTLLIFLPLIIIKPHIYHNNHSLSNVKSIDMLNKTPKKCEAKKSLLNQHTSENTMHCGANLRHSVHCCKIGWLTSLFNVPSHHDMLKITCIVHSVQHKLQHDKAYLRIKGANTSEIPQHIMRYSKFQLERDMYYVKLLINNRRT